MKKMNKLSFLLCMAALWAVCNKSKGERLTASDLDRVLEIAERQSLLMAECLIDEKDKLPKTIDENGNLKVSASKSWTSGFFSGTLWYLYEHSSNEKTKQYAENFMYRVEKEKYMTRNHDIGFMIYCSFGNGWRMTGNERYGEVLMQASESLITRYRPVPNCIRSWDWNEAVWQYPVIIDNMMNLELLMWASRNSGDPKYAAIAKAHADVTLQHHFRPDFSCYHVVSYDTLSGLVEKKMTYQGYADESAWSRGQGWALYGYTMMFRETGDSTYLQQARRIARFILDHPRLPEDKIPYWDFDDPAIPGALRDASAGALIASALLELSRYSDEQAAREYIDVAGLQLRTLSTPEYLAKPGTNACFILKHSVGNKPQGVEIDVPLTYADYYFVEALLRYKNYLAGA